MKKRCICLLIFFLTFSSTPPGYAAEPDGEEKVFAVQNKIFHRYHEIGISAGYIADDDFYNVYPVSLNYTFNYNEHISWEIFNARWNITRDKDIRKDLEEQFGVTPTEFTEPRYYIHSNVILKPFYGKDAVFNRGIINRESYLLGGAGIVSYERKFSDGRADIENALSLSIGWGTKYFLNEKLCLNLEIRDFVNFKSDNSENVIYVGIGLGYRFNLSARKTEKDKTVEKLENYLRK